MIASLLIPAIALLDVAEYFPAEAGAKWVYETITDGTRITTTTSAGEPVTVGDAPAIPFKTSSSGTLLETIYYRTTPDSVLLVAYDPKKPFDDPRAILKLGADGKAKWEVDTNEEGMPLTIKNEVSTKGKRKILDRDVDVLELKVDAVLGDKGSMAMEFKQTAIYARGIGLAEMAEERRVNKKLYKRRVVLTKYAPPSVGGM